MSKQLSNRDKKILAMANEMIDYFVNLSSFENRDDIQVNFDNEQAMSINSEAITSIHRTHGYCTISLRNDIEFTDEEYKKAILHEIAHCLTREFIMYYQTFVEPEDETEDQDNSISSIVFDQTHEKIAKRLAIILEYVWDNRTRII